MVPEGHRLAIWRWVNPGITHRHGLGLIDQRRLQFPHRLVAARDRAAHPKAEIGRDLVVARARGVEAPGNGPDQLGEAGLDVEVDVFVRLAELKGAALDLAADLL